MTPNNTNASRRFSLLTLLESLGNKLPHPSVLFIIFSLIVVLLSAIFTASGSSVSHPSNGTIISAKSLLSSEGLRWMISSAVSNFMQFAPVGPVIVAVMGIAVAEHSGLLGALLKKLTRNIPARFLSLAIVFTGVISSLGFDAGYVVLIPLAGLIFKAAGRAPLAGIAAAFAGVSGGYSANLLLGPVDAILSGISTEAVHLVDSNAAVLASDNYYFIIVSTFLVSIVGALITDKVIEPRLAKSSIEEENLVSEDHQGDEPAAKISASKLPAENERLALRWAGLFSIAYLLFLAMLVIPENALLRNPDPNGLAALPLLKNFVVFIALYAALAGALYGFISGAYRSASDWIEGMESGVATLASYLVMMFFAAQFVNYFAWSGLGTLAAINGANWLQQAQLSHTSLLLAFILVSALINLMIGSASAKWAILAPVFLPMLYITGVAPEAAQMAYRIGDSSTNIITPLMPYFGVVLAFAQRHQAKTGMGTLISLMLPYSLALLLAWSILLLGWMMLELPLGP
ncbi:AbgT family transporter [Spongiibacter sp. KMU-158]|uniref:AbgT family transporter n=2 Tax=Spongiibacter pelagi TaxID=2760804 RepID=A0A927C486_9GAMM|nr:AbgT family transporter [Spongiibacter pelagi]